jgi:hypothetical protein
MTAYFLPWFSDRIRLRSVVLPAPRYPVRTVTGMGLAGAVSVMENPAWREAIKPQEDVSSSI